MIILIWWTQISNVYMLYVPNNTHDKKNLPQFQHQFQLQRQEFQPQFQRQTQESQLQFQLQLQRFQLELQLQ